MVCKRLTIEDRRIKKPNLGGWRNRITKLEYLNAESQTGPRKMPSRNTCTKMTQYIAVTDVETQTPCHHPTQMWRPDCFISSELDKYVASKHYETYEEMMRRLDHDGKARIIQRNWRAYLLLKNVKEYARQYRELVENCKLYEEEKATMFNRRREQETLRKIDPKTRLDFDMLYDLVEKWRLDRIDYAKKRFFRAARCAEGYLTLEKTVEMLNLIDKQRTCVRAAHRNRKRARFLGVNCKPVRWVGYRQKQIEMVTMRNQKARELKTIYDSLTNYMVTRGERMEILTMLRQSLEYHNCVPAFDLIRLVEQELDYLARGLAKGMSLDYFRERIVFGYLYFVRSCHSCCCATNDDFCGNADDEKLREAVETKTMVCRSCSKLLPHRKFTVHGRMTKLSTCIACTWLRERSIAHVNYEHHAFLLSCVRSEERARGSPSAIAFTMQKEDMHHLVNNVWHGRSVISENDDLFLLRMIRYNQETEWSPWNCILLTTEEAEVHRRIKDPSSVYSKHLVEKILLCHQLARNQFKRLMKFESEFRETFHKIEDKPVYRAAIKVEDYNFM
ncbi:IQ motif and ubiquitin-like domain-containing protein [Nomia melanderi]|uniref:IQ motif and ubiquitin-like domain-containing protein n=1 Tax=Nomia melanderi TaxID=2448451 RepID=UPI003FCD24F9